MQIQKYLMDIVDIYFKKIIDFRYGEHNLQFSVSQELFSSQEVDTGTQRLLRSLLFEKIDSFTKALDLGCGYGPIGVVLKKINPAAEVHMVDRDALALVYAEANAKLNQVHDNLSVYGSLGYDSVTDTNFDLIVSNIPAKVGEHVLSHMLKDARSHLMPNGKVIIVVIDAIAEFVHQQLTTDESIEITFQRSWPGHHVYHYRFRPEIEATLPHESLAFERGEYARQTNQFTFNQKGISVSTTFHLPEFDTLSFDTSLLLHSLEKLKNKAEQVLVFNPGQGYIPLAVNSSFQPQQLSLVDRDLQALRVSQENLIANGYPKNKVPIYHQVGIDTHHQNLDLVTGILPEQQKSEVYQLYLDQVASQLKLGGLCLLCSSSTIITRIEELLGTDSALETVARDRKKSRSALLLKKSD